MSITLPPTEERDVLRKEVERLKTVPMKYRRMAFNAQLQEENKALWERVEALERDALRLKHVRDNGLQIRTRQFKRKTWYAVGNLAQQEYDYHLTLEAAIDAAMKGEV